MPLSARCADGDRSGAGAVRVRSFTPESTKSERQAAREAVAAYHEGAAYHEARLDELIRHGGESIDRFRAGELDAFETDQIVFQYSRATKELLTR